MKVIIPTTIFTNNQIEDDPSNATWMLADIIEPEKQFEPKAKQMPHKRIEHKSADLNTGKFFQQPQNPICNHIP